MNGLKRMEMTERRVFSEEDEMELLGTETSALVSEEDLAKEQNSRISENYKKLFAYESEEPVQGVADTLVEEPQVELAPVQEDVMADEADLNPT